MSEGGLFGVEEIAYFNGDLFDESETVELSGVALFHLVQAVRKNWRDIEPSIFGTLFEGVLDATKRSYLGAHYTSSDDIMLVVEPVVMKPLRREWGETMRRAGELIAGGKREDAHANLDAAAAAYGWPADLSDQRILENLLALNLQRHNEESQGGAT